MTTRHLSVVEAGRLDYLGAWDLQRNLARLRRDGAIPDTLLLTEHPPTYTVGRSGSRGNLLIDESTLERVGARCYEVDRGGDITFHGPGQLIGYLIMDLGRAERGLRRFVSNLEQSIIDTLSAFGIDGAPSPGKPGVWVKGRKIAAIGVAVSRRVTYHGFALNVDPDLGYFDYMIPCGIPGSSATSMRRELDRPVVRDDVVEEVVRQLSRVYDVRPTRDKMISNLHAVAERLDGRHAFEHEAPDSDAAVD
jgi:lipoate-protein ligase B